MTHFALEYSKHVNEVLHEYMMPTWFYKHEIYEVPGLVTALLITYDNQTDDSFHVFSETTWNEFSSRMTKVAHEWVSNFPLEFMQELAKRPEKTIVGWVSRTFYYVRGGSNPEYWTKERADEDIKRLLIASFQMHGEMIEQDVSTVKERIPVGGERAQEYEDFLRVMINYLFIEHLGECKAQERTEPGNEGLEIRDLLCQNQSESGFWKDLKDKYSCTEILFEAKNTDELDRDNLRQTYCYLKPALGLWGFIVCRSEQPDKIHAYNRTLFKNFAQTRGVLILTVQDINRMVQIKRHGQDPSNYLRDLMSRFVRSI